MSIPPARREGRRAPAPDGPVVGLCVGPRCTALRELRGGPHPLPEAVRATPGAVLLHTWCPGACVLACVAVVARRDGSSGRAGRALWLAGIEAPDRSAALADWVVRGGPASGADPARSLPPDLRAALVPIRPAGRPDNSRN